MDYHEYIIKEGVFIGEFDEMYKNCENPWRQRDNVYQAHKMACLASIDRIKPDKILEIGCGLGYLTAFYSSVFPNVHFTGMDISETAIKKAKSVFPRGDFVCGDISAIENYSTYMGGYDAIILSEILWYIIDDIDKIIDRLNNTYKGKYILINQSFYPEGEQKYGTDCFTTPEEMIDYFGMKCLNHAVAYENGVNGYNAHVALQV